MHDERTELLGQARQAVERGDYAEAQALARLPSPTPETS
jgi:hypothetical protein